MENFEKYQSPKREVMTAEEREVLFNKAKRREHYLASMDPEKAERIRSLIAEHAEIVQQREKATDEREREGYAKQLLALEDALRAFIAS